MVGLACLAALCAAVFPFAPVRQPLVRYQWPHAPGRADAIPLMPYQPVYLRASWSCAAAGSVPSGTLLATMPLHPDSEAPKLSGLRVEVHGGRLSVHSGRSTIADMPRAPRGDCVWTLVSDPSGTRLDLDGRQVARVGGDSRPAVAGIFTQARDTQGMHVSIVADNRFQTSPSLVKQALGAGCALALTAMFVTLARCERRSRRIRWLPRRWWRPRAVDAAVVALLALWTVIGPSTVDDGYISGIIRSRGENGFVGNAFRWLNTPESPWGWFYELGHLWAQVSVTPLWLRLPSTLLALGCWILLSRLVIPRFGRFGARSRTQWITALAFAAWWLPFGLGMRPEPWVAFGVLAVVCLVERAVASRTVLPLAMGLAVAGATAALTPAGIMAFAPYLVALRPIFRMMRGGSALRPGPLLLVMSGAVSVTLLFAFADQSLAAVAESVRVRRLIGDGRPWFDEYERYVHLLAPGYFEGSMVKRVPVLLTLLGIAAVAWVLLRPRRAPGVASGPACRIVGITVVCLLVFTFTPTKWTHHFGDLAGVGAAVLVLAIHTWVRAYSHDVRELIVGLAAVTCVGSLVLAGRNVWPFVSDLGLPWNKSTPALYGHSLGGELLAVGTALVVAVTINSAWRAGPDAAWPQRWPRFVPSPAFLTVVVLVVTVVFSVASFGEAAYSRRNSYTLTQSNVASLTGPSCGLADSLAVETDPSRGALPVAVNGANSWYTLDPAQRSRKLPVALTGYGHVAVEFGRRNGSRVSTVEIEWAADGSSDMRFLAPRGADVVRVVSGEASRPRSPRLTPMSAVLPPGTPALMTWQVGFPFPCLRPAALPDGTAEVPPWRIGPTIGDDTGEITTPDKGGPFATARTLVREKHLPVYLRGEPLRHVVEVYRWIPVESLNHPVPEISDRTVPGWYKQGRATVPGLD